MTPGKKNKLDRLSLDAWKCQSTEAPQCHWPDCGCDPYATEVINHLVDQGWRSAHKTAKREED